MRTVLQSILHLTRTRTQTFDNFNTSPGLVGAVGSSYEDYSVTKDTEEKLTEVRLAQRKG